MAERYGEVPPKFTKAWWGYFWMYYKWPVLGTVLAAIIIIVTIVQCAGKEKYDLIVNFCTSEMYNSEVTENVEKSLAEYTEDADGNGESNVFFQQITFYNDSVNAEMDYTLQMKHDMELTADYSFLYIYDKAEADIMFARDEIDNVYVDPTEWAGDAMNDGREVLYSKAGKACAVSLAGSKYLEEMGIKSDDLYVAVRMDYSEKDNNKASQRSAMTIGRMMLEK